MAQDGEIHLHLQALGGTLRRLRTERGHSLLEVAMGTGLSTSFLSLVENGRSDISTGRLYRVARFLGVGLGDLLDMDTPRGPTVVRSHERQAVDFPAEGLHMFPLVNDHDRVAMAPVFGELEVGGDVSDLPRMDGTEQFVFMVHGEVEITLDSGERVLLQTGDSAYLGDAHPVDVRNVGDERASMLWVASPPPIGGAAPD